MSRILFAVLIVVVVIFVLYQNITENANNPNYSGTERVVTGWVEEAGYWFKTTIDDLFADDEKDQPQQ